MQIIIVCESEPKERIDYRYIKGVIDYYYKSRDFKITPIYAKGKSRVTQMERQINDNTAKYKGETYTLICVDYDSSNNYLNDEIIEYCKRKNYFLVWMNRDVEDVFWGERVNEKEKVKKVTEFGKQKDNLIPKIMNLRNSNPTRCYPSSNLLIILDSILKRYKK